MDGWPVGKDVTCPDCGATETAIVPEGSEIVASEEEAHGKVWADCDSCEAEFLVYYRPAE